MLLLKEPLIQHSIPITQWTKVGTDIFTLKGADYLVVVDYTSNFPEIIKLRGTTSTHVIEALKSTMARYGIPRMVFSDNGPQFSSVEFKTFAKDYNFQHVTSSPYFAKVTGRQRRLFKLRKDSSRSLHRTTKPYI